jgi:FHA domain-containing protein
MVPGRGFEAHPARAWDTREVGAFGRARQGLARVLNAAFVEGLISDETHAYRLSLLYGPGLIDPEHLVGDLTLHDARRSRRARNLWSSIVRDARRVVSRESRIEPPLLLLLDRAGCDRLLVGRHPSCDIVVNEMTVSRHHAQLVHRDGSWVIQDLQSTNGTVLNGKRVGRTVVHPGDVLTLGGQAIEIG